MRRTLSIGALLFLSAGTLACTYSVRKFNWMYPAGDSIGEIGLKRTFDAKGNDLGCMGAFASGKIKAKRGRLLVWEVRNGCSAYEGYAVELRDFIPTSCGQIKRPLYGKSTAGSGVAIASLFSGCTDIQKGIKGYVPPNGTGFLGCTVNQDAPTGCYTYAIYVDGKEVADPEVEIEN